MFFSSSVFRELLPIAAVRRFDRSVSVRESVSPHISSHHIIISQYPIPSKGFLSFYSCSPVSVSQSVSQSCQSVRNPHTYHIKNRNRGSPPRGTRLETPHSTTPSSAVVRDSRFPFRLLLVAWILVLLSLAPALTPVSYSSKLH